MYTLGTQSAETTRGALIGRRYWSVTNVEYMYHRTAGRIRTMIATVWLVAGLVCIAPLLGWKDPLWMDRVVVDNDCTVSQDLYYQIFATTSSFYLPLIVILFLYWRIFDVAKKQTRRKPGQAVNPPATRPIGGPPPKPIEGSHAVKDALNQAQIKGGIAAAVVAVIGQPLPTMSGKPEIYTIHP
ncbi:hypothetical protein QAD02_011680 [Eretmocerus hayati]|uniref:Uncharacterized protein n=1 Tax=Eretmocerus hayati TaxID=131215 RepID=A0ACC2NX87_9HYME|nr:hypothetical protein QAD02_011680 [Eretmocerus hayati]